MTILKMYSVRDIKAALYGQPFALANRNVAIRTFTSWCADPSSFFSKYPGDFQLFEVGEFDQNTGIFTPAQPDYLVSATDVVPLAS